jgi:hypothetical protein
MGGGGPGPGGGDGPGAGISEAGQPPPGTDGRASPPTDCPVFTVAGRWLPMDFLVLLDRSPSGDRAAWTRLLDTLIAQMPTAGTDWGLYAFPKFAPACSIGTVPSNVDLAVLPDNHQNVAAGVDYKLWGGEGMPAAAAIEVGAAHLGTLPPDEPKFLLLVTDRTPTCGGTGNQVAPADPAQAESDTLAAIARAGAAKIATIVLAPSTTASSNVAVLDALAVAGGYPRVVGTHKFHDETTLPELFTPPWLLTCKIALEGRPPEREITRVTFSDLQVPRDTAHVNGWDYVGTSADMIELYGSSCDQLIASGKFEVKVTYDCLL